MALKYMVESLEGLDDSVKGLYAERDGKYELAVEGIEDVYVPRSNFIKERDARRAAEERAKGALSEEDAEEFERLRQLADKGRNTDEILTRWKEKAAKKEAADQAAIQAEREKRAKRELEITATELIAKYKGNMRILKNHVLEELRAEIVDGEITVAPARATSLDEIMVNFRKDPDFGLAFSDSGHSGGGAHGGGGGGIGKGKTISRAQYEQMTPAQRNEHFSAGGGIAD